MGDLPMELPKCFSMLRIGDNLVIQMHFINMRQALTIIAVISSNLSIYHVWRPRFRPSPPVRGAFFGLCARRSCLLGDRCRVVAFPVESFPNSFSGSRYFSPVAGSYRDLLSCLKAAFILLPPFYCQSFTFDKLRRYYLIIICRTALS
jgi:hypothetical protein